MICLAILLFSLTYCNGDFTVNVCENEEASINCEGDKLRIVSANYGRTDPTICGGNGNINTTCTLSSSLATVKDSCQYKTECTLSAKTSTFGTDPCLNTRKYLNVTVGCVEKKTIEVCNLMVYAITCPANQKIDLVKVYWGRRDCLVCAILDIPNCERCNDSTAALKSLENSCQGKKSCFITTALLPMSTCTLLSHPYLRLTYSCLE